MIPSSFPVDEKVVRLLQDGLSNNNTTENGSITPNDRGRVVGNGLRAYEFVGFLFLYFVLFVCCVLPIFRAYRRRRSIEERVAQQQQVDQQQYQRNLVALRNFIMNVSGAVLTDAEAVKVERKLRVTQALLKTTFTVQEKDVVDRKGNNDEDKNKHGEKSSSMKLDEELGYAVDEEEETNGSFFLSLPNGETLPNADRTVSGGCAICLCPYEPGDQVAWSATCPHAFHSECIVPWLAKNEELEQPKCPCCRQDYCRVEPVLTPLSSSSSSSRGMNPPFLIPANFFSGNSNERSIAVETTPDLMASTMSTSSSTSSLMALTTNRDSVDDVEQPVDTPEGWEEGDTEVTGAGEEGGSVSFLVVEDARQQVEDPSSSAEPTAQSTSDDMEGTDGASSLTIVEPATIPSSSPEDEQEPMPEEPC